MTNDDVPTRYVHIRLDGREESYPAKPKNIPTLRVETINEGKVERTYTFLRNGRQIEPKGYGWHFHSQDHVSVTWLREATDWTVGHRTRVRRSKVR